MILYIYLILIVKIRKTAGTAVTVLLKFDTLHSLENYLRSVYCNIFRLTLYFQVHFIKVDSTSNVKNVMKNELKK